MLPRFATVTEHTMFMMVSVALLGIGFFRGFQVHLIELDFVWLALEIAMLDAIASALMFSGFIVLSATIFGVRKKRSSNRIELVENGEACTAIIPAYQEVSTLPRSVNSLLETEYENLSVLIACQKNDPQTVAVAEELAEHPQVDVTVNTERSQSKSGNINYAVEQVDSPLVAIFDADNKIHEKFIPAAIAQIEEGHDIVQGRVIPEPNGILESIAYYEKAIFSSISRQVLYLVTDFRLVLSNVTVLRRETLQDLDGYDEQMLTEDYDFAYRCYMAKANVKTLLVYPTRTEAAHTFSDWWGQRKRWMTGYCQVLHRLLSQLPSARNYRDLLSAGICASTVFGGAFMLMFASKFTILFLLGFEKIYLIPVMVLILTATAIRTVDYRAGYTTKPGVDVLVVPFVLPFFALVTIKSVLSYTLTWQGEWYHAMRQ